MNQQEKYFTGLNTKSGCDSLEKQICLGYYEPHNSLSFPFHIDCYKKLRGKKNCGQVQKGRKMKPREGAAAQ